MGRVGIRIANLALFVLSCFLVANVINQIGGAMLIPTRPAAMPTEPSTLPAQSPWQAREAILDRNLFEAQLVSDQLDFEPPPEETLQQTKLPLRLLGTIASEDQNVARAAIEHTSTKQHEVVKTGDQLKSHEEVQVARIDRGRVILQNGSRREELKLAEGVIPSASPPPDTRSSRRMSRRRSRREDSRDRNSMKERLEQLAEEGGNRSPAAIFSQARIVPKYQDGGMVGIELSKIKADSFYEKVGLEDGDVVTELNGIKIDNPSASSQALRAFTEQDDLVVSVQKPSGQTVTVSITPEMLSQIPLE